MNKKPLYKIARCGIFAAIICICAFLVIPVGTVPVSMAVGAVMLCGVVLSPLEAFSASAVYVIMGALGLPVFSGGSGGIGVLLGPTGGYIWAYPLLAFTVSLFSLLSRKKKALKYVFTFIGCITGTAICYVCGTAQYMLLTDASFYTALFTCIIPFIIADILKSFVATFIGVSLRKKLHRF